MTNLPPTGRPVGLEAIRPCLEGVIPVGIATIAADGTPNVTYLSQVHYVDSAHVALSYQFFNKTRRNLLANGRALLQLIDPVTAATYRIAVAHERTETEGPLFESMRAKLAGIASHTGMDGVFRLLGADICRVVAIEAVPGDSLPERRATIDFLPPLRSLAQMLARAGDLSDALERLTAGLHERLGFTHTAVLLHDPGNDTLYTVASRGYESSGIGAELPMGAGVIGTAARARTAIRITHMTSDVAYARLSGGESVPATLGQAIPMPGLADPGSQLAVPIEDACGLLGILFAESPTDLAFTYDHEDALAVLAAQLAPIVRRGMADAPDLPEAQPRPVRPGGRPIDIRYFRANDSVFIGDDYLIKGVAGAIFWILAQAFANEGRSAFSNRELRVHPALHLPAYSENLEARLHLLERRLAEKAAGIALERTGRGRFRLVVDRPLRLVDMACAPA